MARKCRCSTRYRMSQTNLGGPIPASPAATLDRSSGCPARESHQVVACRAILASRSTVLRSWSLRVLMPSLARQRCVSHGTMTSHFNIQHYSFLHTCEIVAIFHLRSA